MKQNRDRPFFLYFAANVPHYPYQGEPEWLKRYQHLTHARKLYAAFLSTLDERIGQLLDQVNSFGLDQRTIIVFQSDHGYSVEQRAHHGGGSAGPFRGAKFSLFEGGFRVPAIISWPGQLPSGETRDQLAHGCDWLPTLAELTGTEIPDRHVDGKSLVPVIRAASAASPHDVLHWTSGRSWAVRQGDWKLIMHPRDPTQQDSLNNADDPWLSNLARDISETKNFADEHPELVSELIGLHERWIRSVAEKSH